MIDVICNNAVNGSLTVLVGLLVADENVIRLFLLGEIENTLLNAVYLNSLLRIDRALADVSVSQRQLVVSVLKNGLIGY